MNLAGLVKHVARTEEVWVQGLLLGRAEKAGSEDDYVNGFRLLEGETLAGQLDEWARIARETEAAVPPSPAWKAPSPCPTPRGTRRA